MPLPLVAEKIEDIPEAARGAYVARDGKHYLDTEIEDVSGIKANRDRALSEKKRAESERDQLRSIFGDRKPEEVAAILKAQADHEADKSTDTEKVARREKLLREEYEAKLAPLLESDRRLKEKEYEDQVWAAAKASGALDSDRRLILKAAKDDYIKRDDKGKIVVIDEHGDETGDDLKTLFSGRFKKENMKLYAGEAGSGGGANGGGSGGRSAGTATEASGWQDYVGRITSDANALKQAKAGKLTVRDS